MNVLLDANVILDVLAERAPFLPASAAVLYKAESKDITAFISATTWTTLFYILRKHIGTSRALSALAALRTYCKVSPVTNAVIDSAFHAVGTAQSFTDFEDAVQYFSALEIDAACIITRNIKDFAYSSLPVYTPEQFLEI